MLDRVLIVGNTRLLLLVFVCPFVLSRSLVLKALPGIVVTYTLGIRQRRKWTGRNLGFCDVEMMCSFCLAQVLTVKPVEGKS